MATVNPYLQVEGLTRRVGERVLFENISFGIAERQHVGLIAQNGTGKTTLLNILAKGDSYDEGSIVYKNGIRVGYLEQNPHMPMELNVLEACYWTLNIDQMDEDQAQVYRVRAKQVLTKLNITKLDQPLTQLSGGELKRVSLANVLIVEPDLLILDEPTNHLDIQMIEWLEGYLSRSCMTLLMVTHDRYFLDRVCDTILEMADRTLYQYKGNYAYYLEQRESRIAVTNARIQRANNLYRTELDWMRRMPQARGHKARYREEAFYELEKVAKQRMEERRMRLKVKSSYIGSKIFEAEYVSKAYGNKVLLKDFYYNFGRYEKMGIVGANGTGKSTFVRMLLGEVKPDSGRFVVGETVRFGYFSQQGTTHDEGMKVIDAVRKVAEYVDLGGGRQLSAMQFLQHFMFEPQQQQDYVYKLSGGERRRLDLCLVLMQSPNFLVLDEPTNDLDIVTLQVLEEYLQDFQGCVIVISHDRYFMDKVVDHLLVFQGDGRIKDFPGNYTQYRQWSQLPSDDKVQKAKARDAEPAANRSQQREKKRLTFKEKQEFEQLDADIQRLEAEKKLIVDDLSGGTISVEKIAELSKRLPQLEEELDEKSMRWLELSELA